jgi:hypothetical protein
MNTKKVMLSLAVLLTFFLFMGLNPTESLAREKYTEKFDKTVKLAKDGKVIISNISGSIEVRTWDRAEVKIDAVKTSRTNSESQAQENFRNAKIAVTEEGKILRIKTDYAKRYFRGRNKNCSIEFKLTIPSGADADVNSTSGSVDVENIGGSLKVDVTSGKTTIDGVRGSAKIKSTSGKVEIMNANGGVDCYVVSGSLIVKKVVGDLDLETISGKVELSDASDAKVIRVKVLSGTIRYDGQLRSDGRYKMNTHSGNIYMTIPSNSAFDFDGQTFSGKVDSEFDILVSGTISKKRIRGTVNGGGSELELKTFSGNIYLKKR